ncbi:MAG: ImmA/IrrE family metallo-endopeptidase [Chitinophagales bacterium]|nr:ImmA/IrrE family metallo-endopeptidase [Chitinophagales bacterium]
MASKYIEQKTEDLLKKYQLFKAPIDIESLVSEIGISLFGKKLEDNISGVLIIREGKPMISFNENEKKVERRRFTIAHELGHFILHSKNQPMFIDRKMYRDINSTTGEKQWEVEANSFAASILMPKALIDEEIKSIQDGSDCAPVLAKRFRVSDVAMNYRLLNLGYITN